MADDEDLQSHPDIPQEEERDLQVLIQQGREILDRWDQLIEDLGSLRETLSTGLASLLSGQTTISGTLTTFLAEWEAANTQSPGPATSAVLTVQGGDMAGSINVDTTNETVTIGFVDDHGDVADAPVAASGAALVVTFGSSDPAVVTVATDPANPLQGDVSVLAKGTSDLSASLSYADGSAVVLPDGSPFPDPTPVTVTVGPGPAVEDALVLSV